MNQAKIVTSSCTSELKTIRELVKTACEQFAVDEKRTNLVVLAIDEACANVIRHGYHYDKNGVLCIEAYEQDGYGVFLIKDQCPKICESILQPSKEELLAPGGLGLNMIHQVMDSVKLVSHDDTGNHLELKLKI